MLIIDGHEIDKKMTTQKKMEKISIHKEVIKTSRNDLLIRYDEATRKVKVLLQFGITYLINDTVYY